jgi:hypothetical protein
MSTEFSTWLLGLGGYAGLFGSLAVFYLYPNFPRNYLPVLFVVPVISAAALYAFFQVLYLVLWFTVKVLESMLNEHLTIILLSTTFIGGQAVLIGYVVYKNAFLNNVVLNNAAYEVEQEQEQEQEQELQPEEYENADDEEENEEDSGADADNEEGTLNSVPPITTNTPATAAPVINDTCVDCDDDCMKCMPPLTSHDLMTGLSGEIPAGVVCEGGVCRIDGNATATTTAAANAANAAIKNMMEEFAENVKID